jgi:penicillin-binding protein 1B
MHMVKKAIITLSILTVACVVLISLFCYTVIRDVPWDSVYFSSKPSASASVFSDEIEPESLVRTRDLETFWSWSKTDLSLDDYIRIKKAKVSFNNKKGEAFVESGMQLMPLKKNDCELVYCLQSRLSFQQIPSLLWKGLIGIEDYRFLNHSGVDPKSLLRAIWHDIKVMRLEQGGSTLTQQLVKNLFYSNERKFSRKIKEMIVSAYLEYKLEKEQILQAYFNEVIWGSLQGIKIKGVAAASFFYFLKKPNELSPYEVSILIGLLKGPYFYSPVNHLNRLKKRAKVVFNKLNELKMFSGKAQAWSSEEWDKWATLIKERASGQNIRSLYFLSKKEIQSFQYYSLISEAQRVQGSLKKKYPKKDLAVKTILFKVDKNSVEPLFSHYSKYERSSDQAFNSEKHQVGSTLKPLIYGILSMKGVALDDLVKTTPITLKLKSGSWTPREAHSGLPEEVTLKEALIKSLNRPLIRSVNKFGFDKMENELKQRIPDLLTPLSEYPAQLLGSVELTMAELARVYADFLQTACFHGLGSQALHALSDPLTTTVRFRVGKRLGQMRFFGKTGTTNNGFDNWFIGFDGKLLHLTWAGLEGKREAGKELKIYGSNTSFLIYKNFFQFRGKLFNEMACQENSTGNL